MAPKSQLWKHFEKSSSGTATATCRHCGKVLKTSGNTSNLKSHLNSKHPHLLATTATVPGLPGASKDSKAKSSDSNLVKPSTSKGKGMTPKISKISFLQRERLEEELRDDEGLLEMTDDSPTFTTSKSPVSQKTIKEAFKKVEDLKDGGSLSNRITQAIIYMLCKDGEPLYMVEHKGFLHLMKTLAPQYKVPTRRTIKTYIEDKYKVLSEVVRQQLQGKKCTLTTDAWTDNTMESYLSLTVHFFDGNKGISSSTIGVLPLSERHTGEYLAQKLTEWCSEWGINTDPSSDNVTAVVSDNCANIVKAIEIAFGNKKFIPCFAHTINLVVENTLKLPMLEAITSKAKNIVKWFKQSIVASDELRKASDKKLIQSVTTRWNSTYYMLQRIIELRPVINDIINRYPNAPPMLTASELEDVTELIQLLEPFEAATVKMSGEYYLTTSMAIPIVSIITASLDKITMTKTSTIHALSEAKKEMRKRFGQIEHKFLIAIATMLDPRFKRMYFSDATAQAKIINFLSTQMRKMAKDQAELAQQELAASSSSEEDLAEPKKRKRMDLFADHNKTVDKTWQQHSLQLSTTSAMPEELSLYLGAPPEKIETKPLAFWRDNASTYPNLAPIATTYLTTIATSVPSERLFSKAGELKSKKRNRMKGKWLSKLLFLQNASDDVWGFY